MSRDQRGVAARHHALNDSASQLRSAEPVLDGVDRAIASALASDAGSTLKELAEVVGLSTSAVHARVERLGQAGLIRGSRAILNYSALGVPITALIAMTSRVMPFDELAAHVASFAEVVSCYTVAGEDGLVLLVRTTSVEALDVLRRALIAGTDATAHTSLVLRTHFEDRCAMPAACGDATWSNGSSSP